MEIHTFKAEGLAQLSYLVADPGAGAAVIIDPRRDIDAYESFLAERQWTLKAVLETHLHADFASGAASLQATYGCPWLGGPAGEDAHDGFTRLEDKATITVGDGQLVARHVPGHSPEHLAFCLRETADAPIWAVFTGDLLFAESVGRPDLAAGLSGEELAHMLHRSLHEVLLPLGDGVIVYPGHGAGSSCGPDIGPRDVTSIGFERAHNPLLQHRDAEDFVRTLCAALDREPNFYKRLKEANTRGIPPARTMPPLPALALSTFLERAAEDGVTLLDGRETEAFRAASTPGSLNLPSRDSFPAWAGRVFAPEDRILLVASDGKTVETMQRHLFRLGIDRVEGSLAGGFRTWIEAGQSIQRETVESVENVEERLADDPDALGHLLDVREPEAYEAGALPEAESHPVVEMVEDGALPNLPRDARLTVYCGSDFRASLAASWLRRAGFLDVRVLLGSIKAWKRSGADLETPA